MSEPKADLSGWDLRYNNVDDAAEPGDELTMYNEIKDRTFEWTATVESVGPREMTLDDGTKIEASSLDVIRRAETGYGMTLDRVVVSG
jgi:hypothetical protein